MRSLKKYLPFFKAGMMQRISYKAYIYSWLFVTVLQLACMIFLWYAVYSNSETGILHGFTFGQAVCYFVCMNIFSFSAMDSGTMDEISHEIRDGTIALSFTKPISYRWRFLFSCLGGNTVAILIMGLPAMITAFIIFGCTGLFVINSVGIFILHFLIFCVDAFFAICMFDVLDYIAGVLCFYTTNAWGLSMLKRVLISFLSGALLPLAFFPEGFGKVLSVLPFAGMGQEPILILLQMVDIKTSLLFTLRNILWWVAFEVIAWLFFKLASKKVTVQGG